MKTVAAFFKGLLWLAVIAVLAYNTYQIRQLRAEVEQLRTARLAGAASPAPASLSQSLQMLRASKQHADRAQALLQAKRFEEAAKETRWAAEAAQKAYAGAQSTDPVGELQSTIQSLSKQVGALWKQERKEPK